MLPTGQPSTRDPSYLPIAGNEGQVSLIPTGQPSITPTLLPTALEAIPTGMPSALGMKPTGMPSALGTNPTGMPTLRNSDTPSSVPTTSIVAVTDNRRYVQIDVNYFVIALFIIIALLAIRLYCRRRDSFSKFQAQVATFSENLAYSSLAVNNDEEPRRQDILSPRQLELSRFQRMSTARYPAPLTHTPRSGRSNEMRSAFSISSNDSGSERGMGNRGNDRQPLMRNVISDF